MRQRLLEQRLSRGRKAFAECIDLIPESQRRDDHSVASEDSLLPRERDVIQVFVERDLDREGERVTTTLDRALGTDRSFDASAAAANVFLLLDVHEPVADLDEVDHLGRLELPRHRLESLTAGRAGAVGLVELEHLLFDWQSKLLSGPLTWTAAYATARPSERQVGRP